MIALQEVQSAASGGWRLWGEYSLADPLFLFLVPLALGLLAWGRVRGGRARGRVPAVPGRIVRSVRQRFGWVPVALQGLALVLAIVCLSRPLRGNVEHSTVSAGVDIVLVLDRSGSMRFDDLEKGKNRLEVVKQVVGDFATRRMTDRESAADNVALISFARFPRLLCPFTLDVHALASFLEDVELVDRREEDGTGIGVALTKAVSVLRGSAAKSRIVVLLTDGENNVHDITPGDAAELAAEEGVRVYTIYAARYLYVHHPFRGYVPQSGTSDTSALQNIAELTGGAFYRAKDRDSLEDIYAEIEELERTERTERRFEESFDLYLPFLLAAIAFYGLSWLSSATWARRLL